MNKISLIYFLSLFLSSLALYSPKSDVILLSKANFASSVFPSDHLWLVEFFAPWCGHCKSLAPHWEQAATNLKNLVKVAAIDCDVEKELCGAYKIQGFPTIKVFPAKRVENPYQKGAPFKEPEDYQGARQASAIVNYALARMPSFVTAVSSKNSADFLKDQTPKALLFTNKDKTTSLYKALSSELNGRMKLGEVKHTEAEIVKKYGVTAFPTLLAIPQGNADPVKYEGKEYKFGPLSSFLGKYALKAKKETSPPPKGSSKKEEKPKEPEKPLVIPKVEDPESFNKTCTRLCVVALLSPLDSGEAKHEEYLQTLLKGGKKFQNMFQFLWIDGVEQIEWMEHFNLASGFPTLIVYSPVKNAFVPMFGSFEEKPISTFLDQVIKGTKKPSAMKKSPPELKRPQKEEGKQEAKKEVDEKQEAKKEVDVKQEKVEEPRMKIDEVKGKDDL